jgi:ankyrin repeat protein
LDPVRAEGLLAVATLLLDAGADPNALSDNRRWSPLRCAVTSANSGRANEPIIRLLLDRGATVEDGDLYPAGFAGSWCVQLLLERAPNVAEIDEQALGAPISTGDLDTVRLLLDAGADPNRYRDGDGRRVAVVAEALTAGASNEVIELLLSQADRETAMRLAADHPGLPERLTGAEAATIVTAAEAGDAAAVAVMLDVGLPIGARNDGHGATALHTAAHSGSVETVKLLLSHGADIEAQDEIFKGNALDWAVVGSGERPSRAPDPDWEEVVRILLDAGSSTDGIVLAPGEVGQPSPEVAGLLRDRIK